MACSRERMRRRTLRNQVLPSRLKPKMNLPMLRRRPRPERRRQMATRRRNAGVADAGGGEEVEPEARHPERKRLPHRLAWKKTDRPRRCPLRKILRRPWQLWPQPQWPRLLLHRKHPRAWLCWRLECRALERVHGSSGTRSLRSRATSCGHCYLTIRPNSVFRT